MVQELIRSLKKRKIFLRLEDSKLIVDAPEGALTDIMIAEIKQNKAAIIDLLERRSNDIFFSIRSIEKKDYYSTSAAQKRMFILQQMNVAATTYNMPSLINLGDNVNKNEIEKAFCQLISRHESFRTSFEMIGEEMVQIIHDHVKFQIDEIQVEDFQEQIIK